jgi:hypothetical protein
MKKLIKWFGKKIDGAGAEFRENPLTFSISIAILALVIFIFFGDINIKASHGDTKIEVTTDYED